MDSPFKRPSEDFSRSSLLVCRCKTEGSLAPRSGMQIFPGPALLLMLFFLFVYVIKVQGCCGAGRLVLDPEPKSYNPDSDYPDSTNEKKKN